MKIRWAYDRCISTMTFPEMVKHRFILNQGPYVRVKVNKVTAMLKRTYVPHCLYGYLVGTATVLFRPGMSRCGSVSDCRFLWFRKSPQKTIVSDSCIVIEHVGNFIAKSLLWHHYIVGTYSISKEICTRFLLCCALLWLYIDWFSHIHQAYFTGTAAI